jgi:hypothetical protein
MAAVAVAATARRATAALTSASLPALLSSVDTFLFDCDGVLWRGGVGVPGVGAVVASLRALGKRCYFVTNNSTKARASYVEVLSRVAGIAAQPDAILSSAFAAAEYLRAAGVTGKVYVIGEAGLVKELTEVAGVQCLGMEDAGKTFTFGTTRSDDLDKDVKAVVCVGSSARGARARARARSLNPCTFPPSLPPPRAAPAAAAWALTAPLTTLSCSAPCPTCATRSRAFPLLPPTAT